MTCWFGFAKKKRGGFLDDLPGWKVQMFLFWTFFFYVFFCTERNFRLKCWNFGAIKLVADMNYSYLGIEISKQTDDMSATQTNKMLTIICFWRFCVNKSTTFIFPSSTFLFQFPYETQAPQCDLKNGQGCDRWLKVLLPCIKWCILPCAFVSVKNLPKPPYRQGIFRQRHDGTRCGCFRIADGCGCKGNTTPSERLVM